MNRFLVDGVLTIFAAVLLLGSLGHFLDRADAIESELRGSGEEERAAQQQERLKKAARAMCGENSAPIQIDATTWSCVTKRGFKTELTARVQL